MATTLLPREVEVLKPVKDNMNSSPNLMPTSNKRLTMVERARLEALASFGNEGLNSLSVKKIDFSSKLKANKPSNNNKEERLKRLTRMQRAKAEANAAFKNVQLGQMTSNTRKRKIQNTGDNENGKKPNQNTLTRIQRAKLEAEKAFENVALGKIPKKKSKLEKEKMERKLVEGKPFVKTSEFGNGESPFQVSKSVKTCSNASGMVMGSTRQPIRSVDTNTPKRITRSQSVKLEALKSFDFKGLEDFGSHKVCQKNVTKGSNQQDHDVAIGKPADIVSSLAPKGQQHFSSPALHEDTGYKRLTRLEKAKLEALHSFSGQEFDDICKRSTRIVAKYLKPKKDQACITEEQKLCHTTTYTPKSKQKDELKLEEKSLVHSYLLKTGGKDTNTEDEYVKHKRPKVDVYSSIVEGNFKDHSSLLETSRRVVETAILLETPEGSPASMS